MARTPQSRTPGLCFGPLTATRRLARPLDRRFAQPAASSRAESLLVGDIRRLGPKAVGVDVRSAQTTAVQMDEFGYCINPAAANAIP
jgi:hypothetical protein